VTLYWSTMAFQFVSNASIANKSLAVKISTQQTQAAVLGRRIEPTNAIMYVSSKFLVILPVTDLMVVLLAQYLKSLSVKRALKKLSLYIKSFSHRHQNTSQKPSLETF
jgi:2-phospho-L-lactate transferase/gluconeogenesis factor (CofD/UPF0052 family)